MKKKDTSGIETNFEVRCFDAKISLEEYSKLPKNPIYIVLDNLRSAFNVGAIFRLCDAMRVSGLFLCGYTACPPHKKLAKTSLGTIDYVPWKKFNNTIDAVEYLKKNDIVVWAAETTSISLPYYSIPIPSRVGIIFGNEALGVDPEVLKICDNIIEIPLYGFKNSLNVANSCAVICFKILEQIKQKNLIKSC
jgi:tRNA G18 (ribose-2'-O)-methylase SpoU